MKNLTITSLVGLITTVIGVVLGWYLSNVYQQPEIMWYSRAYYKTVDASIGNIYLWNAGHKSDHNITITLDSNINSDDIKIVDLTSSYKVTHNDNKTTIIIEELKPQESADITFKDDQKKDDISITNFISESSNIKEVPLATEKHWWQFPLWLEIVLLISVLLIGFLSGYLFYKQKYSKS